MTWQVSKSLVSNRIYLVLDISQLGLEYSYIPWNIQHRWSFFYHRCSARPNNYCLHLGTSTLVIASNEMLLFSSQICKERFLSIFVNVLNKSLRFYKSLTPRLFWRNMNLEFVSSMHWVCTIAYCIPLLIFPFNHSVSLNYISIL